jgi:hypothetical protein
MGVYAVPSFFVDNDTMLQVNMESVEHGSMGIKPCKALQRVKLNQEKEPGL